MGESVIVSLVDGEKIKQHPDHKGISCCTNGDVYSSYSGKKRKPNKRKDRYLQVSIGRSTYLLHRLVAQTFINNPKNKPHINHKNGVRDDNRVDNIEWCTPRENVVHARDKLGIIFSLPKFQNSNSKFKESHQIILRNLYERGFTFKDIAEIMGFCRPTVRRHLDEITK